jgi:hypothetical protein
MIRDSSILKLSLVLAVAIASVPGLASATGTRYFHASACQMRSGDAAQFCRTIGDDCCVCRLVSD